jgi:aryl-alcohol dehydrogenase-like predicted oxidoreductase/predicted kinase
MRLSTDEDRNAELPLSTIAAAAEAGVSVFDTARAYGRGEADLGHNERLLARGLRECGATANARIVTKGGMARTGDAWVPDGRAKAIRADCEASLVALGGLEIDLYLIHAPDPRTPWRTSVRALARLFDERLVRRVGISNVNRGQLDEALELAPISAVQVALSPFDDGALRAGVVARCADAGIAVMAHSPLGGPRRVGGLSRQQILAEIAQTHGATSAEVALAWVLGLSPVVVAIPGARRPETARSAAKAARLSLGAADRAALERTFGTARPARGAPRRPRDDADVVLIMGIPGSGKTRLAGEYAARGYVRLNRDERGGSLRELALELDEQLSAGTRRVVLDNTYLTRAGRSFVIETATRYRVATQCVWLDTPLAQAQVNLVERLLDRFGSLPTPEQLRDLHRDEPGLHTPTSQMRAVRELEPPSTDEGFAAVRQLPFARAEQTDRVGAGVFLAAAAFAHDGWERAIEQGDPAAPHLLFEWSPDGTQDALAPQVRRLSAEVSGPVDVAVCPHPAGPPICWCRPPLPGLLLAFAHRHRIDHARSLLVGTSRAHRTLATTLDALYLPVSAGGVG